MHCYQEFTTNNHLVGIPQLHIFPVPRMVSSMVDSNNNMDLDLKPITF